MERAFRLTLVVVLALLCAVPALGATFGTDPIPVSVGPSGQGANAPSGSAAISGDNRTARYVAFHSNASNLVPGDTNGMQDVFLYGRPSGSAGVSRLDQQPARPAGSLIRVSVGPHGQQANGNSADPALDGSVQRAPRCVAFQSDATNLSPSDHDGQWDIYVHDLKAGTTRLVSGGVGPAAVDPAISGDCRQVAFTAFVRENRPPE